jgi:indolepyruvate ferredoxin oxidoreductase alpha subunit
MTFSDIVDPEPKTAFMLTNHVVARAVLESDTKVTAFYPGSPTSEILDSLMELSRSYPDLVMEVSSNEKVALETIVGASMAGARSFTSMKSVGLNVASDAFYCPAIQVDMETRQTRIQEDLCNGRGNCARLCPRSAIHTTGGD